jgi:hypothetical protein
MSLGKEKTLKIVGFDEKFVFLVEKLIQKIPQSFLGKFVNEVVELEP